MKPVVDGLAKQYDGKIEFRRYNVEADTSGIQLANDLGVQYVPTFVVVNSSGVISKQVVGSQTDAQMKQMLDVLQ